MQFKSSPTKIINPVFIYAPQPPDSRPCSHHKQEDK